MKVSAICPYCNHRYVYDNDEKTPISNSCRHLAFVRYDDYGNLVEIYYNTTINSWVSVSEFID